MEAAVRAVVEAHGSERLRAALRERDALVAMS
jgi:hypothetical protein